MVSKLVQNDSKLSISIQTISTRATNRQELQKLFSTLAQACGTIFTMAPPDANNDTPETHACAILHSELVKIRRVIDEQMQLIGGDEAANALCGLAGNTLRLSANLKAL